MKFPRWPNAAQTAIMAAAGACCFGLGVVGAWAKEFAAWLPRRLPDSLIIAGLAIAFAAVAAAGWRLFCATPPPDRREGRLLARGLALAALPPLIFLGWWFWQRAMTFAP